MRRLGSTTILLALMTTVASAQTTQPQNRTNQNGMQAGPPAQVLTTIPNEGVTVTHWYKQNVYDPKDNKIGEIMDVLVDRSGKATALIVGVGGFLGAGEKDVAVPFDAVHTTKKSNNDFYLVMNANKDELKNAKGFKYDRNAMSWIPEEQARTTTGAGNGAAAPGAPAPATRPNAR